MISISVATLALTLPPYDFAFDDPFGIISNAQVVGQNWASVRYTAPVGSLTVADNFKSHVYAGTVNFLDLSGNAFTNVTLDRVLYGHAEDNTGGYTSIGAAGGYSINDQIGGSTWFDRIRGDVHVEDTENHSVGASNADGSEWMIQKSVDIYTSLYSFKGGEYSAEEVRGLYLYASSAHGAAVRLEELNGGGVSVWGDELTLEVSESKLGSVDVSGDDAYADIWGSAIGKLYVGGEDTFVFIGGTQIADGYIGQGASVHLNDSFANLTLGQGVQASAYDSRVIFNLEGNNRVELSGGQALIDADNDLSDIIVLREGVIADIAADSFDTISFGTTDWSVVELQRNAAGDQTHHFFGDIQFTLTTPAPVDDTPIG